MFTQHVVFATPPFALINAIFLNHSPQVRPSRIANHSQATKQVQLSPIGDSSRPAPGSTPQR